MNRQTAFDLFTFARAGLLQTIEDLTLAQINLVPAGFNNNLAWQLAHVIAVDQKLIYDRGGLPMHVDAAMYDTYGNGTKPERDITQQELDTLKKLAMETVEKLKADCAANRFDSYTPHKLRDLTFNTVDDALGFILLHEGMHMGAARDLRRAVLAQMPAKAAA